MKLITAAAIALAALSTHAIAQTAPAEKSDGGSLSSGAKDAMPATKSEGTTDMPTAKAEEGKGSLSDKAMKDQPGNASGTGSTDMPTAKPNSGSLSDKAMKDQPGTK